LRQEVEPDPELLAVYRDAVDQQCAAFGLGPGKDEHVEEMAKYCESEIARMKRGEETLLRKMHDAFFDVIAADKNHDGFITVEEYKMMWKVYGLDPDVAGAVFKNMSEVQDGRIPRRELHEQSHNGWFARHVPTC
jgi:hypothetical protein